jgi:hypothetical protein
LIKTICLRFNLNKPLDSKAFEYLQGMDKSQFKSYSHAAALALTEYFQRYYIKSDDPYFETREREEKFVQRIVAQIGTAVEKAMPLFLAACLTGLAQPCLTATPSEPSNQTDEIADVDLDFIGE